MWLLVVFFCFFKLLCLIFSLTNNIPFPFMKMGQKPIRGKNRQLLLNNIILLFRLSAPLNSQITLHGMSVQVTEKG